VTLDEEMMLRQGLSEIKLRRYRDGWLFRAFVNF